MTDRVTETAAAIFRPAEVGISGCAGSGKTTLANELARTLGGIHFRLDSYYRDLAHLPFSERVVTELRKRGLARSFPV